MTTPDTHGLRKYHRVIPTPVGFITLDVVLLPDSRIAAELTAVDQEKGKNVTIGLDPPIYDSLIYLHRTLRGWARRKRHLDKERQPPAERKETTP